MSLDDLTDFIGLVVHYGEMERISNSGINTGNFIVVVWVVEDLRFSVRFCGDVSGRMGRISRIPEKTGAADTTEVVLTEKDV
jgi:hypothetical protein